MSIFDALVDDPDKLRIIVFCSESPRKTSEIADSLGWVLGTVARYVAFLESVKALEYTRDGWISTKLAKEIIIKYFT